MNGKSRSPVTPAVDAREDTLASSAVDAADEAAPFRLLRSLASDGAAALPLPAHGHTLARWQALARVAAQDLALAKLYEGHTDALAILAEAGAGAAAMQAGATTWGMWAAEAAGARVDFQRLADGRCLLSGVKSWCSGAAAVDRGLLTVWDGSTDGPWLAAVEMKQPGVRIDATSWRAVGMAGSASADVHFDRAEAHLVGYAGFYLSRPGFWQGGAGVAACWHGGACALADALLRQLGTSTAPAREQAAAGSGWPRLLALGAIDKTLAANAALFREAARWIDEHPRKDARAWALRLRAAADAAAETVVHHATRALGATPLCRDRAFARRVADLPVFVRQSHGDRDLVALGEIVVQQEASTWRL